MDQIIIAVQVPHQGRVMAFSHFTMEDFISSLRRQFERVADVPEIEAFMDAWLDEVTPDMCRAALAHDMASAKVYTMAEAVETIRTGGLYAKSLIDELAYYGWTPDVRYMHPMSGYVQTMADWIDDSSDWHGDIESQMASLIPVVMDQNGDWMED